VVKERLEGRTRGAWYKLGQDGSPYKQTPTRESKRNRGRGKGKRQRYHPNESGIVTYVQKNQFSLLSPNGKETLSRGTHLALFRGNAFLGPGMKQSTFRDTRKKNGGQKATIVTTNCALVAAEMRKKGYWG